MESTTIKWKFKDIEHVFTSKKEMLNADIQNRRQRMGLKWDHEAEIVPEIISNDFGIVYDAEAEPKAEVNETEKVAEPVKEKKKAAKKKN